MPSGSGFVGTGTFCVRAALPDTVPMLIPQTDTVLLTAGKVAWVVRQVTKDLFHPRDWTISLEAATSDDLIAESLHIRLEHWSSWCQENGVTSQGELFVRPVRPTAQEALWAWQNVLGRVRTPAWSDSAL